MKTFTIGWLNKCRCGNKSHSVKTARGNESALWDDDAVKCNSCGRGGVIQVCEGQARVLWETDEEIAEGKPMSTITKERIANLLQFNSEGSNCQANAEQWEVHELARIALASLEAEASGRNPVLAYADSYRDMANQGVESIPVWSVITDLERNIAPLFTAPPAPISVPAAMEMDDDFDSSFEHGKAVGWNACRAAMLQGAENGESPTTIQTAPALDSSPKIADSTSGNSPVIQDAYDIEAFGVFSATEGENGLMLQIERFRFGTGKCPQIGKENMVPKFALQAIINRLQEHCDSMGNEALVDILSTPAAPQQELTK
ncbi:TPA: hypothetical protein R4289_003225 [Enterobacter mori]|nr:hypothetical protein [Enterobacter mori]